MGARVQYHEKFQSRPMKSPGKRKQRVKAQKRRLVAGGMDPGVVSKLDVRGTREALKRLEK